MHKSWSMGGIFGALGALAVLAGCEPVKDDRPPVLDARAADAAEVAIDAAIDAPPPVDYDIGYVNEITFSNGTISIGSFVVVVNRSTVPLALAMTDVVTFSDDNAAVNWTFSKQGASTTLLPPGQAAGELSPLAVQRIIDSGLVPEPRVMSSNFSFGMQFSNVPPNTTFNLNGQATISIQGERITLPFTIHFIPGSNTLFNNASRIRSP